MIDPGRCSRSIPRKRSAWLRGCAAVVAAVGLGCGGEDPRAAFRRFVPDPAEARAAVDAALAAWRDAPDPVPASFETRAIKFVDQQRKARQRLRRFEVLGESEAENARQFTVRLVLDQPEETLLARYNVFGRGPVWVFRLEDYEMISHWEHEMPAPGAATAEYATGIGPPGDKAPLSAVNDRLP
jgi:hypothetical protein